MQNDSPDPFTRMPIDDPKSVDVVSVDPRTGNALLDIADHLEWEDERAHLILLEDKINAYIGYIESGQLLDDYPEANGLKPEIHVACLHAPPIRAQQFFAEVTDVLQKAGIAFSFRQSHFNSSPNAR